MVGRIRSIKPEWSEDEKLCMCGPYARVLSVILITWADDYGNGRLGPEPALAALAFPREADSGEDFRGFFRGAVAELEGWYLMRYSRNGQSYYHLVHWDDHQKVDHPGKPQVPRPSDDEVREIRETLARPSRDSRENSRDPRETLGNPRETLAPDLDLDQDLDQDQDQDRAHACAKESEKQERKVLSLIRPSQDLTPYITEILEAQRKAWDLEIPPQPPKGDDMERLVQAYHLGEAHAPGDGVLWACLAVKGHRARVCRGDLDGLAAEKRMAWPPVQESGPDGRQRAKWRELDAARYAELVEEGRNIGKPKRPVWADGRPRMPGV